MANWQIGKIAQLGETAYVTPDHVLDDYMPRKEPVAQSHQAAYILTESGERVYVSNAHVLAKMKNLGVGVRVRVRIMELCLFIGAPHIVLKGCDVATEIEPLPGECDPSQ